MAAESELPLSHLRVLEIATEIAGPYAGKLFADAGADVVKVEPPSGDPDAPLHRGRPAGRRGFGAVRVPQHVASGRWSGRRTTPHVLALAGAADVVIVDAGVSAATVEFCGLRAAGGPLSSAITPFGLTGPERGGAGDGIHAAGAAAARRAAAGSPSAFRWLPAAGSGSGSAAPTGRSRGWRTPGGRASTAIGELVDVSLLEAMLITMGGLGVVAAQIMGVAQRPLPGAAVDRADRRRLRGFLHHHRSAVPGLPGAHRASGMARRR